MINWKQDSRDEKEFKKLPKKVQKKVEKIAFERLMKNGDGPHTHLMLIYNNYYTYVTS